MPTINQLIRKSRQSMQEKSTAPALKNCPQKRGFAQEYILLLLKNQTPHCVKLPVFV